MSADQMHASLKSEYKYMLQKVSKNRAHKLLTN